MAKKSQKLIFEQALIKKLAGKCGRLDITRPMPGPRVQHKGKWIETTWEDVCQSVERAIKSGRVKLTAKNLSVTCFDGARSVVLSVEGDIYLTPDRGWKKKKEAAEEASWNKTVADWDSDVMR